MPTVTCIDLSVERAAFCMGGHSVPASREVRVLLALQTPPASAQARLLPPEIPCVSLKFPQTGSDSVTFTCVWFRLFILVL